MKLWILTHETYVNEDTTYLIGNLVARAQAAVRTPVGENDSALPDPPLNIDVILNRSYNSNRRFLSQLDRLAAQLGIVAVNPGAATYDACDKRSYWDSYPQFIPRTGIACSIDDLYRLRKEFGCDLVMKCPFGRHGKQVERFRGEKDARVAKRMLTESGVGELSVQELCTGFLEGDKRIIVQRSPRQGHEIVAWFRRVPPPGGWKSNVSSGGRIESCDLEPEEKELALAVAAQSGLDYVGVDVGWHAGRYWLIETNAYTGGHVDYDVHRRQLSGSVFARMIEHLYRQGRC